MKANKLVLNKENIFTLIHTVEEFCPTSPIDVPEDLLSKYSLMVEQPKVAPVDMITSDGDTQTIYVPAVFPPDGELVEVMIPVDEGFQPVLVKAIPYADGSKDLLIPNGTGFTTVHVIPAPLVQETPAPETPAPEVVMVVPTTDGSEMPVIIPDVPTIIDQAEVKLPTKDGDYELELVTATPNTDGKGESLQIPGENGTTTTVQKEYGPEGKPLDPAETVVTVTAPDGTNIEIIIPDVPIVDGQRPVKLLNPDGSIEVVLVTAIPSPDGQTVTLEIPDNNGGYIPVDVAKPPKEYTAHGTTNVADIINRLGGYDDIIPPSTTEIVIDVPTSDGSSIEVTIPDVTTVNGTRPIEIETENGTITELVTAIPNPNGQGEILEIPDGNGGITPIEVTNAPNATTTAAPEVVVDVSTAEGSPIPVSIPDVPTIDGQRPVEVHTENGVEVQLVNVVPNPDGQGESLEIPNGNGTFTRVEVTNAPAVAPAEVIIAGQGGQGQIILPNVPEINGQVEVKVPTSDGGYKVELATAVPKADGQGVSLEIPDGGGGYTTVDVIGLPSEASTTPSEQEFKDLPTEHGSQATVIIPDVPSINGERPVEFKTDNGTDVELVAAVSSSDGQSETLEIPDGNGSYTAVEVANPPGRVSVHPPEQIVQVPTSDGSQSAIVVVGMPPIDNALEIKKPTGDGGYKLELATAQPNPNGQGVIVDTDGSGSSAPVDIVNVPTETPTTQGTNIADIINKLGGYDEIPTQPPSASVVEVTTSDGNTSSVILPNIPTIDGQHVVEVPTDDGYRPVLVTAVPNPDGLGEVLEFPDGSTGGFEHVEVTTAPGETTTQPDTTLVNGTAANGSQVPIIIVDVPLIDDQRVVKLPNADGSTDLELVATIPSTDGHTETLEIPDGSGGFTPVEITVPTATVPILSDYMTKEQFQKRIEEFYGNKRTELLDGTTRAKLESEQLAEKVKGLDDCIEQAANKVCRNLCRPYAFGIVAQLVFVIVVWLVRRLRTSSAL